MPASSLRHLDWKVLVVALVGCYLIPAILIGTVLAAALRDVVPPHVQDGLTGILAIIAFLFPPVTGGYVAARFAPRLPWLHVAVVGVLGAVMSLLSFRATPRAMVAYALASLALAVFGGYLRLQRAGREKA
jgi:hypothetical protein